jgi:transposase-like protein
MVQIKTDNQHLSDWQVLETVCLDASCPSCGEENLTAIEYPSDNQVSFECTDCEWSSTFNLSDAREAGYYPETI